MRQPILLNFFPVLVYIWPKMTAVFHVFGLVNQLFNHFSSTRSYAALRAADLDWIVGPGYSWGGYVWGVLNVSFCASGTQLGLDFLSIDFFRIYFVSFKLFFSQILCFIQS